MTLKQKSKVKPIDIMVALEKENIESRPVWKPMHKQPVYADAVAYVNGVSEELFKVGFCLPAGPYVTDDDAHYIVVCIKEAIVKERSALM